MKLRPQRILKPPRESHLHYPRFEVRRKPFAMQGYQEEPRATLDPWNVGGPAGLNAHLIKHTALFFSGKELGTSGRRRRKINAVDLCQRFLPWAVLTFGGHVNHHCGGISCASAEV